MKIQINFSGVPFLSGPQKFLRVFSGWYLTLRSAVVVFSHQRPGLSLLDRKRPTECHLLSPTGRTVNFLFDIATYWVLKVLSVVSFR